jgi:hypothetical protein
MSRRCKIDPAHCYKYGCLRRTVHIPQVARWAVDEDFLSKIYLLDEQLRNITSTHQTGEICVAGPQLSSGYPLCQVTSAVQADIFPNFLSLCGGIDMDKLLPVLFGSFGESKIYLLDEQLRNITSTHQTGEICVAGPQLSSRPMLMRGCCVSARSTRHTVTNMVASVGPYTFHRWMRPSHFVVCATSLWEVRL